jgi:hypothetical protein
VEADLRAGVPNMPGGPPGPSAIQKVIDDTERVIRSGNPVAYAPYIRKSPLHGEGTPVLYQFAEGDRAVPNPTTTALLRAGDLADRATYFRNDLWRPASNPHGFLTFGVGPEPGILAQAQMAVFLASDGATTNRSRWPGSGVRSADRGPAPRGAELLSAGAIPGRT